MEYTNTAKFPFFKLQVFIIFKNYLNQNLNYLVRYKELKHDLKLPIVFINFNFNQ